MRDTEVFYDLDILICAVEGKLSPRDICTVLYWPHVLLLYISSVCRGGQAHLSLAAVRCSSTSSSGVEGGGKMTFVPGYERVKELQQ